MSRLWVIRPTRFMVIKSCILWLLLMVVIHSQPEWSSIFIYSFSHYGWISLNQLLYVMVMAGQLFGLFNISQTICLLMYEFMMWAMISYEGKVMPACDTRWSRNNVTNQAQNFSWSGKRCSSSCPVPSIKSSLASIVLCLHFPVATFTTIHNHF